MRGDPVWEEWWRYLIAGVLIGLGILATVYMVVWLSWRVTEKTNETQQKRIEVCRTIEDPSARTLCVTK